MTRPARALDDARSDGPARDTDDAARETAGAARDPVGPGSRPLADPPTARVAALLERRLEAGGRFFAAEADRTAALCHRMAERFARGGRLVALGRSAAARSDARHVAVEFVHPVIVGKRALPALGLAAEGGPLDLQADLLLEPDDIVIGFGLDGSRDEDAERQPTDADAHGTLRAGQAADAAETRRALDIATGRGCLAIDYGGGDAEWSFGVPSSDPFVRQEIAETHYHLLWELVHVFFEHRGLLEGRTARTPHDPGDSRFLYPFLGERESDLDAVLGDVRASVVMKAEEVDALRRQTLEDGAGTLVAAAADLRDRFERGATLLAFGNGGSATDAMDVVADLRLPPHGWPSRPALDLTADSAILSAIANDIGTDALFSRQIIAYGREGDVALALSTSGDSRNVIRALEEARKRGLSTLAFVGYDGGRVAAEGLADHIVVTRSEHIPRIQEAQASAVHVLRELVEREADPAVRGERS